MSNEVSKEEAKKELEKNASKITEEDIVKVLEQKEKIQEKFTNGPLGKFMSEVKILMEMLKDYIDGNYKEIPWYMIAAVTAALLYVFSQIDLIPDFIPLAGLLDDAMVIAVCLELVELELEKYKEWKRKQIIVE